MTGPELFVLGLPALLCAGAWAEARHFRHLARKDARR